MVEMPDKKFECPKCTFEVKGGSEEVVLRHAAMHAKEQHPEEEMTEEELREMIKETQEKMS